MHDQVSPPPIVHRNPNSSILRIEHQSPTPDLDPRGGFETDSNLLATLGTVQALPHVLKSIFIRSNGRRWMMPSAEYSSAPWFTGLTPVDYLNMTGSLSSGHVEGANSLTHVLPEAANLPDLCVAVLRKISLKHAQTSMGS